MGQVSNPPDSIGTAVEPQVVIKRTNGRELSGVAAETMHPAIAETIQSQDCQPLDMPSRIRLGSRTRSFLHSARSQNIEVAPK
jgi:hypothetical protein